MSWLVGLPLGIFRLLFTVVVLAVRFAVPIAIVALIVIFLRHRRRGSGGTEANQSAPREPEFRGPVYTVDYEEVEDQDQ